MKTGGPITIDVHKLQIIGFGRGGLIHISHAIDFGHLQHCPAALLWMPVLDFSWSTQREPVRFGLN